MHSRSTKSRSAIVLLLATSMLAACTSPQDLPALPTPTAACHPLYDWGGMAPGKSTREDVDRLLGTPEVEGTIRSDEWGQLSYSGYPAGHTVFPDGIRHVVFFRADGVVHSIDVIVADRDGRFHPVQEIHNEIGMMPDTVYLNTDVQQSQGQPSGDAYDTHSGPDVVYVWAACGLAVTTLTVGEDHLASTDCRTEAQEHDADQSPEPVIAPLKTPQYREPVTPNGCSAVMVEFLFQPTSYEGFVDFYMDSVPVYSISTWAQVLLNLQ